MSGIEFMRGEHVGALLASSGTSTATLVVIVIGEALIIALLVLLVLLLRRNLDRERVSRRSPDVAFVSGTLEVPVDRVVVPGSASAAIPPPPEETPAVDAPAGLAPPPAVSWDMNKQVEEEILDPENMPIPAYTGPKLEMRRPSTDVDFDLGIEDDFGEPPAAEAAANDAAASFTVSGEAEAAASGSRRFRRSRRGGQAPPPPFT